MTEYNDEGLRTTIDHNLSAEGDGNSPIKVEVLSEYNS